MTKLSIVAATTVALAASSVSSFSVTNNNPTRITTSRASSSVLNLIRGEAVDAETFDKNEGGVGLALRSAIKISGKCQKDQCDAQELMRYEKMQEVEMSVAQSIMEKSGCSVLCSGMGKELYQDPESTIRYEDKLVKFAPIEAAKAALENVAAAPSDAKYVALNFAGGDDLIIGEILEACDMLVDGLNLEGKPKVSFNSISFNQFADETCSVTVVASGGNTGGLEGVDESIAKGELYAYDGKWFTVAEGDITTAEK
mmetsp:Transcript_2604/g.4735  ORF Transcript_2604/g.4735 Transcript_2604/m.4735 type:complete len:256 (-) Transcript_2604:97-864(-)